MINKVIDQLEEDALCNSIKNTLLTVKIKSKQSRKNARIGSKNKPHEVYIHQACCTPGWEAVF